MKYIKYFIMMLLLFPLSVKADEGYVLVDCPEDVKALEEIECEITGYSSYEVSALEFGFALPDNVEKISSKVHSIWEGSEEDNLFLLYTDENKKDNFVIGTLSLKVKEDMAKVDITTTYLAFGDEEFIQHIIVLQEDVKQMETDYKKDETKKNNYIKYVIIILIIGVIVVSTIFVIKTRSDKDEK